MNFVRIETKMPPDQRIVLENIPFKPGDLLEILILERNPTPPQPGQPGGTDLKRLLQSWMKNGPHCSKHEIDRDISHERSSWE